MSGHSSSSRSSSSSPVRRRAPINLNTIVLDKPHLHSMATASATPDPDLTQDAFVTAGSLITFEGQVDAQTKADLLQSTLLAQLAAAHRVGGAAAVESHADAWYDEYRRVLDGVGWVVEGFGFQQVRTESASFTVDGLVGGLLQAALTPSEAGVLQALLKAVTGLAGTDRRRALFDAHAVHRNSGNFQVGVGTVVDGTPVLKLACLRLQYDADVADLFGARFELARARVTAAHQSMSLNRDLYALVRDPIRKKLGDSARSFIDSVDIDTTTTDTTIKAVDGVKLFWFQ